MKKLFALLFVIVCSSSTFFSQEYLSTVKVKKDMASYQENDNGEIYIINYSNYVNRNITKINSKGEIASTKKVGVGTINNMSLGLKLLITPDGKTNYYSMPSYDFKKKKANKFLFSFDELGRVQSIDLSKLLIVKSKIENVTLDNEYVYILTSRDVDKKRKSYYLYRLNHETKKIEEMHSDFHSTINKFNIFINDLYCVGQTENFLLFNEIKLTSNGIETHFFRVSKKNGEIKEFNYEIATHDWYPLVYIKGDSDGDAYIYRYSKRTYSSGMDKYSYKNSEIGNVRINKEGDVVISGFLYNGNCMKNLKEFYYLSFNLENPTEKKPIYTIINERKPGEKTEHAPYHLRIPTNMIIRDDFYLIEMTYYINLKSTHYVIAGEIKEGKLQNFIYINPGDDDKKADKVLEDKVDKMRNDLDLSELALGKKEFVIRPRAQNSKRVLVRSGNELKIYSLD